MLFSEACKKPCLSAQRIYLGSEMDRRREGQNFENHGTSMHSPSPIGVLVETPVSGISLVGYPETPFSEKLLCQRSLCLPIPKSQILGPSVLLELGQESGQM